MTGIYLLSGILLLFFVGTVTFLVDIFYDEDRKRIPTPKYKKPKTIDNESIINSDYDDVSILDDNLIMDDNNT